MSATVPYRTSSISGIVSETCSLIGVDAGDLQSTETTILANFMNKGLRHAWESQNWIDICPYGEVRFPINFNWDPNFSQGSTFPYTYPLTNLTLTANAIVNPLDNRTTAASFLETSATGYHNFSPGTFNNAVILGQANANYIMTGYARPNGRNWLYVLVGDAAGNSCSAFLNFSGASPVVGTITQSGFTGTQAAVALCGNGFYKWSVSFQSAANTSQLSQPTLAFSKDGIFANLSYAGSTSAGMYMWGVTFYLAQNLVPASYYIPWSQLGETAIDSTSLFDCWSGDPNNGILPARVNYNLTQNGFIIIGPSSIGPVWIWYRPQRPAIPTAIFNAATAYVTGQMFQYTSTAQLTSGVTQGYTVTTATSAGQTPDSNASLFQQIFIPYILSSYMAWYAYACWLLTEGQAAKAQGAFAMAQSFLDDENDKQERQAGWLMPWRVNTHVTSQNRGMGFQNQNYSLTGTATFS